METPLLCLCWSSKLIRKEDPGLGGEEVSMLRAGLGSSFYHIMLTGAQTHGQSQRPIADREIRTEEGGEKRPEQTLCGSVLTRQLSHTVGEMIMTNSSRYYKGETL
jgi:hypothetical protein